MQQVRAKKFLGQHFLTDLSVAQKIAETLTSGRTIEIGLPLTISELGATTQMIDNIVSTTNIFPAGYMDLTPEDIRQILIESL